MHNIPSNTDDVIDSRDVIERIEELENERTALVEALAEAKETLADAEDDTSVFKVRWLLPRGKPGDRCVQRHPG